MVNENTIKNNKRTPNYSRASVSLRFRKKCKMQKSENRKISCLSVFKVWKKMLNKKNRKPKILMLVCL